MPMPAGNKDWALFLGADAGLEYYQMLEAQLLRRSVGVCFREAKQHLGLLQEQTRSMASHSASDHLCAICCLALAYEQVERRRRNVAAVLSDICRHLAMPGFAERLWQLFAALFMARWMICAVGLTARLIRSCRRPAQRLRNFPSPAAAGSCHHEAGT